MEQGFHIEGMYSRTLDAISSPDSWPASMWVTDGHPVCTRALYMSALAGAPLAWHLVWPCTQ